MERGFGEPYLPTGGGAGGDGSGRRRRGGLWLGFAFFALLSSPVVRLGGGYLLLIVDVVAFPLPFAYPPNPWIGFCLLLFFCFLFFFPPPLLREISSCFDWLSFDLVRASVSGPLLAHDDM